TAGSASVRRECRRNGSDSSTMSGTVPKREDAAPGADEPRRRTRSASVPSPHACRLEPTTENRTTAEKNERDLEEQVHTDLNEPMTYGSDLGHDRLLAAERDVSRTEHHDDMLFMIQHQTTALWFRLAIHELLDGRPLIAEDELQTSLKRLARVKHIQK